MNEQSDMYAARNDKYAPEPGSIYEVLVPYDSKAVEHAQELMDRTEVSC
jgi:hypothetical protein